MKTLTRDAIQRMVGPGNGGGGGGGGADVSAGYATQSWCRQNLVTIEFFNRLFKSYNGEGQSAVEVVPNDTESTITNIKAMFGFWSEGFISALGQGTGGGGGGGASALADLDDVDVTGAGSGYVLVYNGTDKWVATSKSSYLSGYATQSWVNTQISDMATKTWVNNQNYLTSSAISDMATKTWVNNQGFLTSSAITDMATKTWVNNQGFLTSSAISDMATQTWVGQNYLGINATAAKATKLANARTLWGQSFDGSSNVSGSLSDVGSVTTIDGGDLIGFKKLSLNYPSGSNSNGGEILFHFAKVSTATSRIIEDASGRLFLDASAGVRIGDGMLVWDSANNALKVQKYDGTSANLYALGGVSALGMSAGTMDAVVDSLTIDNGGSTTALLHMNSQGWLEIDATNIGLTGALYANGINTRGGNLYMNQGRIYLTSSVYLSTNGSDVLLTISGTSYKLTKTAV